VRLNKAVLIQPPFVQLNSPYPAPYYLASFLESRFNVATTVIDHSIGLFHKIFCRVGLELIFEDASQPQSLEKLTVNKNAAAIAERFLSEKNLWLSSIDRLVAFLRGKDAELGHFLALANGCFPGGPRTDAFLSERGGEVAPEEAKLLATKLLSDIADFITCTLDFNFALVRYSQTLEGSLAANMRDFADVKKSLDGYIMKTFYRPMLEEEWERLEKVFNLSGSKSETFLLGLTIPFPGCLSGALVCAESAKKRFGSAVRTIAGGGYVNTELRFMQTSGLKHYFDHVSFDRGYSTLAAIIEGETDETADYTISANKAIDDEAARTIFPDYSAVDFSRYLYPADDANPMHRLWSDGHWLKAYLAHGCYWQSCAFCDVTLDYIKSFIPVDVPSLFAHLCKQAETTGVRGIHFVDEAAPPSSLMEFALLNRNAGLPLNFWGNIRFEKHFTPDAAALLASGGLTGVSAGLEVATAQGFKRLGKGIDLKSAVRACAAFKESGILTHAYLIYGYWDQDEQEIVDSAEVLRQLFAFKLLDSAFWHKFVLTRHSRIYAEKQRGKHPGLKITDDPDIRAAENIFALNDLSFKGEKRFDKYSSPLEKLLAAWMAGDTETPVTEMFPFKMPEPSVPPNLVEGLLNDYIADKEAEKTAEPKEEEGGIVNSRNALFLGSIPRTVQKKGNYYLRWRWRLEERELKTAGAAAAKEIAALLESASLGKGLAVEQFYSTLEKIAGKEDAKTAWELMRKSGLVVCRFLQ